jgi:hypothetical protein
VETGSNHERRRNRLSHQRKESASGWKMVSFFCSYHVHSSRQLPCSTN